MRRQLIVTIWVSFSLIYPSEQHLFSLCWSCRRRSFTALGSPTAQDAFGATVHVILCSEEVTWIFQIEMVSSNMTQWLLSKEQWNEMVSNPVMLRNHKVIIPIESVLMYLGWSNASEVLVVFGQPAIWSWGTVIYSLYTGHCRPIYPMSSTTRKETPSIWDKRSPCCFSPSVKVHLYQKGDLRLGSVRLGYQESSGFRTLRDLPWPHKNALVAGLSMEVGRTKQIGWSHAGSRSFG